MSIKEMILSNINTHITIKEKRPNIYQVCAPFYHEDGDILEVFVQQSPHNPDKIVICDLGLTLMKVSYDLELKGENLKVYNQILSENSLDESNGNIFLETDFENLNSNYLHYVQSISKVSSLHYFKRKRIKNMFYELLFGFVEDKLQIFKPDRDFIPIPDNPEDKVDVVFNAGRIPVFMFGVPNDSKALDVIASCLTFKLASINYKSLIVYEEFDSLSKKTQSRILRVTDKPFMDLNQFQDESLEYLNKEIAA